MRVRFSPSSVEREFSLRPPLWKFVTCAALLSLAMVIIQAEKRDLRVAGYLWGGFILFLAGFIILRLLMNQKIQITAENLILPRSNWSFQEIIIPFQHILYVSEERSRSWLTFTYWRAGNDDNLIERGFYANELGRRDFFELETIFREKVATCARARQERLQERETR